MREGCEGGVGGVSPGFVDSIGVLWGMQSSSKLS